MEFSARVTLAPYETKIGLWFTWLSKEPAVITVGVGEGSNYAEFECAIEERASETVSCARHTSRHTTVPAATWAQVDMPRQREFRMRFKSHASVGIQFDFGLRNSAMP